ncbi:DUF4416 family protein [Desulfonatronospira sp.]|uniref:DUF4416 family protein n=1 Tax=Desulfonatronospira sp. TaxID=1962951 RepID=UPI0025C0DFD7|nr:DUF4416 family protein [Desulfonatronospira sp.]
MSHPEIPRPGKLFLSILSSRWDFFQEELLCRLSRLFGPVDFKSPFILLTETDYYNRELGTPILRRIYTFHPLVELNRLPEIKLATNKLEEEYLQNTKRLFNLDPGLIPLERLVLATGKNFTHRIYLDQGIWADLTLIFTRGDWVDLPWTFPDYASEKIKTYLRTIRTNYRNQLTKT